jgi:hypothetical protein
MNEGREMAPENRKSRVYTFAFFSGLYLVSLLSRLPLIIYPPTDYYYNLDELSVTYISLDRFLGLPSTLLMLPASLLQFLFLPLFLADMVIRRGLPLSSAAFLTELSSQLSHAYVDPHHAVLLMRCLAAVLASAGPVLAYYLVDSLSGSKWAALLGAALVLFNPVFLQHSVMAGADAVAPTLALASVLCLLKTKWGGNFQYAGFLFAAALASRITVASFASIPIIFLLVGDGAATWSERRKALTRFCLGLVFGFLFWCPYVWTDPIRMAKTIYGNVNRPEAYFDVRAFVAGWWQGMGAGFSVAWMVLFIAGCWMVFRYRSAIGLATVGGAVLMTLPLALCASTAVPRYYLPLVPCLVLLWGVVARKSMGRSLLLPAMRKALFVLLALVVMVLAAECVEREREVRGPDELNEVLKIIPSLPHGTVLYLPSWLVGEGRVRLPQEACERLQAKLKDKTGVIQFAEDRGVPKDAAEILVTDFNEKEQAEAAHLAIACRSAPQEPRNVYLYYEPGDYAIGRILADMDLQDALERVRTQKDSAIFIEGMQIPWATPVWKGKGDLFFYQGPEVHP